MTNKELREILQEQLGVLQEELDAFDAEISNLTPKPVSAAGQKKLNAQGWTLTYEVPPVRPELPQVLAHATTLREYNIPAVQSKLSELEKKDDSGEAVVTTKELMEWDLNTDGRFLSQ